MNNDDKINDIVYFLKKNTLKSYQQAQILINAEVQNRSLKENSFDITKDKL